MKSRFEKATHFLSPFANSCYGRCKYYAISAPSNRIEEEEKNNTHNDWWFSFMWSFTGRLHLFIAVVPIAIVHAFYDVLSCVFD